MRSIFTGEKILEGVIYLPNQIVRRLIIENFQDSLRIVRHLMNFGVEDFAEAIGVTRQTVNNLETKKSKMSATQYIAIAALTDSYFANHAERLPKLKAIIDGDGKIYGDEYETSFRDDSLLKRWFEDFISADDDADENFPDDELWNVAQEYKIFLDAEIFKTVDATTFVDKLTATLDALGEKAVLPLRSLEEFEAVGSPQEIFQANFFIKQMKNADVLDVRGEYSDPNFHDTIIKVFKHFRDRYKLCLITTDEQLIGDVLALNDSATENDFKITAGTVDDGEFKFFGEELLPEVEDTPEDFSEKNISGWSEL